MNKGVVDALENVVARLSPLRDDFSIEIIYKLPHPPKFGLHSWFWLMHEHNKIQI